MFFFFVCDCFKWSDEPKGFDERHNVVQCQCGRMMKRTHGRPEEYGFGDKAKTEGKIVRVPQ